MRRFQLMRDEDETGISGTGAVALGVEWPDGKIAMRWATEHRITAIYNNRHDLIAIHGHGGKTRIVWLDPPLPTHRARSADTREQFELLRRRVLKTEPAESGVVIGCFAYCPFCRVESEDIDVTMNALDHQSGCLWTDAKDAG